jgi:basic membrane lipoprotein Med (substrate-binding protein (PBP1-ABC) superfamily)
LADQAFLAASAGDNESAAAMAGAALDLWRGPVLAGVPLHLDRAATESLDEVRVRAIDAYVDASLALGNHRRLVGELRRFVDEDPYREELVARLMIALYRSGRQAEALEQYEHTRRLLADNLGIQPSADLQRLSGHIVRQEADLTAPKALAPFAISEKRTIRTRVATAGVAIVAMALIAVVVGLTLDSSNTGEVSDASHPRARVALVLPRVPRAGREDTFVTPFVNGLMRASHEYAVDTTTLVIDELRPGRARLAWIRRELRTRQYDLVLWAGSGPAAWKTFPVVGELPRTRFVYVDASLDETPLEDTPNATGLRFADDGAGFLAGYLAGLVVARRSPSEHSKPVVSVVGGMPIPQVTGLVHGFARGARQANPGVGVRVAYSGTFSDQSACERIASRQIDRGSSVVFAAAGTCGFGALSAAGLRGVWGVGADADRSYLGPHILVSTVKRCDRAVELAIMWFLHDALPAGDVVLGIDDDAIGITGISPEVAPSDRRTVARLAASLREAEATPSP